jgi:hypothetical protein
MRKTRYRDEVSKETHVKLSYTSLEGGYHLGKRRMNGSIKLRRILTKLDYSTLENGTDTLFRNAVKTTIPLCITSQKSEDLKFLQHRTALTKVYGSDSLLLVDLRIV